MRAFTACAALLALLIVSGPASANCPPTRGLIPMAKTPDAAVLIYGGIHEVAGVATDKPIFITTDARATIQPVVESQLGPKQLIIRPKGGAPLGATVTLDVGFAKAQWTVGLDAVKPPVLTAVRRLGVQLPPNADSKPAWRRWTLKVDGDLRWVKIVGPGGGAGLFPVEPDGRVFVEWGQCMRDRHSLPHTPGIYKAQAVTVSGHTTGPIVAFTLSK